MHRYAQESKDSPIDVYTGELTVNKNSLVYSASEILNSPVMYRYTRESRDSLIDSYTGELTVNKNSLV